jgi:hypothetical protein
MRLGLASVDDLAMLQTRGVLDEGEVSHVARVRQRTEHHERQRQQARPVETSRRVADRSGHVNEVPGEQQLRL